MTWSVVHDTVATVARAEPLVDRSPARVVDAGDDSIDAEGLPGDPRHQHVRVVTVRDRGDGAGSLDAGLDQSIPVETDALDLGAGEVVRQPPERFAAPIDDGNGVAVGQQVLGE